MTDSYSQRLRYAEFGVWVGLVTTTLLVGTVVVAFAMGGGLGLAKIYMFVVGFVLLGVGGFELRPKPAWKEKQRLALEKGKENRLDAVVQRVIPAKVRLPFEYRISLGAKLFVSSLIILATSFVLEAVFGVRAVPR